MATTTPTLTPLTRKRLRQDFKLLHKEPNDYFEAYPTDDDPLVWDFMIRGPKDSDYAGGHYVGKIIHHHQYPLNPPDFMMRTPQGRFMVEKKICLTNSGYHSNEWSPMWTVHAILDGFLSIMLDDVDTGISHIKTSKAERAQLARDSIAYNKRFLKSVIGKFTRFLDENGDPLPEEPKESQDSSS